MGAPIPRRIRGAVYFRRWNCVLCLSGIVCFGTCLLIDCYLVVSNEVMRSVSGESLYLEFNNSDRTDRKRDGALGNRRRRKQTTSRNPVDSHWLRFPGPDQRDSLQQGYERQQEMAMDKEMTRQVEELVKRYWVDYNYPLPPGQSPWEIARRWVTRYELLPDNAPELGAVLREAATAPIYRVDDGGIEGNQLKLMLTLRGGQRAVFKPKWYNREDVWTGNMCDMHDRHNAEIAAFHLSRMLGFRKTALAVGRVLKLSRDVMPVATQRFLDTFYNDTATNETCFYGHCGYCPTEPHHKHASICTVDDTVEGAVILWLPDVIKVHDDRYHSTHPWMRVCYDGESIRRILENKSYCQAVQNSRIQPTALANHDDRYLNPFYNNTSLFLDLMDSVILHYIITNADRKMTWVSKGPYDNLLVMLDNGKSFQHPDRDEWLLLAPLFQCCLLRRSTYERLQLLSESRLSQVLRGVMKDDPVSPILSDPHLSALDRRLGHVMRQIQRCLDWQGQSRVLR